MEFCIHISNIFRFGPEYEVVLCDLILTNTPLTDILSPRWLTPNDINRSTYI